MEVFFFLWLFLPFFRKTARIGEIAVARKCSARAFAVTLVDKRDLLTVPVFDAREPQSASAERALRPRVSRDASWSESVEDLR